jgi:hypothetical protein
MVGKLLAPVPGQRPVKLAGQSLRLLDQCRDDAFGVLVGNFDQHHVARMALDKRCNIAIPRPTDQIAFPMTGDRTIFDRRRSFADGYGVLNLAEPVPLHARVPGSADRAPRPQVLKKLLLQHAARLNEQAAIDRLV